MNRTAKLRGFTLIELLVVIAIIAILAGLIVANINNPFDAVKRNKTRAMFSQLETGINQYHQDYGQIPIFASGGNPAFVNEATTNFIEILTGRPRTATGNLGAFPASVNPRRVQYFNFDNSMILDDMGEPSYANGLVVDGFGNIEIRMNFDTNGNGFINFTGDQGVTRSMSPGGPPEGEILSPASSSLNNVRKIVTFHSAGRGRTQNDVITSW